MHYVDFKTPKLTSPRTLAGGLIQRSPCPIAGGKKLAAPYPYSVCMLNASARVVTGTQKCDRGLGQILHDELHWLDVLDRVFFKLAV